MLRLRRIPIIRIQNQSKRIRPVHQSLKQPTVVINTTRKVKVKQPPQKQLHQVRDTTTGIIQNQVIIQREVVVGPIQEIVTEEVLITVDHLTDREVLEAIIEEAHQIEVLEALDRRLTVQDRQEDHPSLLEVHQEGGKHEKGS